MTQGNISLNELTEVGFEETASPQQGDLAIYVPCVHYGIYYRGNRIRSKLGIGGAVCEHPFSPSLTFVKLNSSIN